MKLTRTFSTPRTRFALVAASAFAIASSTSVSAVVISSGSDLFQTPASSDTTFPTYQDFTGATALPPGFFGAGSDGFTGRVHLRGAPLTGTGLDPKVDTIVERTEATVDLACGGSDTVDIAIRALSLTTEAPFTVTFNGGTSSSQYTLTACLASPPTVQPTGTMTILMTSTEGGSFTASLPVIAGLTFTKVSGALGLANVELDPAPPMVFSSNSYWSLTDPFDMAPFDGIFVSPGGVVDHDCSGASADVPYLPSSANFFAGVRWEFPDDCNPLPPTAGAAYRKVLTQEQALLAAHGVKVVNINKSPIPTVSAWGVAAMTLLVLAAGTVVLRRSARVAV